MTGALSRRVFLARASIAAGTLVLGCADIVTQTISPAPSASHSARPPTASRPSSANATLRPTDEPTPSPTLSTVELRRALAGLLVVGFRGQSAGAEDPIVRAIADEGLGGVILFGRNVSSPAQLDALTAALHAAAAPRRLIVSVDQEGGQVARLGPPNGFVGMPSAALVGRRDSTASALDVGRQIGTTLAAHGINLNLAPVVDLNVNPNNPSIGALDRSYSADASVVRAMAGATIAGQHESGVLTTLKHFPGLGSATGDTDREFVDVSATWSAGELAPYRGLIHDGLADVIMAANALNGQIDARWPASLSAPTHDLLRIQLGWDGVVITDDLQAGALSGSHSESDILRRALVAGNDLLLLAAGGSSDPGLVGRVLDTLVALVRAGSIPSGRVDEARRRVAALTARLSATS